MNRLIQSYTSVENLSNDEILFSDCTLVKSVSSITTKPRMKLMIVYHVNDQEVEYYHEHYDPEELHEMYEDDPDSFIEKTGVSKSEWNSMSHEDQVYCILTYYDYYEDSFDMSGYRMFRENQSIEL